MRNRSLVALEIVVVFLAVTFAASLSENWFYLHYGFEIVWILLGIGIIASFLLLALSRKARRTRRNKPVDQ